MRWNPFSFDVKKLQKLCFSCAKAQRERLAVNCIAEQQQQKHHQTNYFATICTFEKVRRKIWRENIPKITSIFHSLWTNAMLCVKRCTEKHKKCLLQHKNTNKNFVLLFCLWSFQGMRFRVELAAPSHKRILFQVLAGFDVFIAI